MSSLPSTGPRLLAARLLLGFALLLTVLAVFLPVYTVSPFNPVRSDGLRPSLESPAHWWYLITRCCSMLLVRSIFSMQAGAILLVIFTGGLLQVSSLWLVHLYHQSRLLCWIARILALICVAIMPYVLIGYRGSLSSGFHILAAAEFFLLLGLFLIPRHRREAEAAPQSV